MANQSVSEELFQATDVIVAKRLSELQYDQTLICTIENTDNASKGEYIVSDTSSSFTAYSENTDYFTGTKVYVTVPNGDMNNQKMIIGKYVSEEDESFFNYIPPLDDFINVTDNIIQENISTSLLANKGIDNWSQSKRDEFKSTYPDLYKDINSVNSYKKLLWSWSNTDSDIYLMNFDRLGISADFKASLKALGAISGTYGLCIEFEVETTSTVENYAKQRYTLYFDSSDFFGNPYNFGTYYQQQKLFDLSDIMINNNSVIESTNSNITAIKLYAFQDVNFADSNGDVVLFLKEDGAGCELLPDNIWIKNINLCFGFALEDYPDGKVILGCRNGLTYKSTASNNDKKLYLQWAYKEDDNNYIAINSTEEFEKYFPEGKIHWYKYWLTDDVSNNLAGPFWVELLTKKENAKYKDKTALDDLAALKKAGCLSEEVYNNKKTQIFTQINFLKSQDYRNLESLNSFTHTFSPDITVQNEQLKVIIETKSYDNIVEELNPETNTVLKNIYDEFEQLITNSVLKDGGEKYQSMITELKNTRYDGTETAFDLIKVKYDGSTDSNNKVNYPLYMGGNDEIVQEPDPTKYTDSAQFKSDLEKYRSYLERSKSIEWFNQIRDYVLSVYAENQIYKSDVLTLNNELVCANPADVDLIKGLTITVDPEENGGYEGVYLIYGENNSLLNSAEASKKRSLIASYKSYITGETSLDKASKIEWYIPLTNTMIQKPEEGIEYNKNTAYERAYDKWIEYKKDDQRTSEEVEETRAAVVQALKDFQVSEPSFEYNKETLLPTSESKGLLDNYKDTYREENGYAIISRSGTENYKNLETDSDGQSQQIDTQQYFRIKSYYSPFAVNNTVYCKVTKNKLTHEANALLTFGISGSSGTDATFILSLGDNYDAKEGTYTPTNSLTADYADSKYSGSVHVIPRLYDYNNKEVDLSDKTIRYTWYSGMRTDNEIYEKRTAKIKAENYYNSIKNEYDQASPEARNVKKTFIWYEDNTDIDTTLNLMLEHAKKNYEEKKAEYEEVEAETGAYYIDFQKGEDGKQITSTKGSTGVEIIISDMVKNDPGKLCHAILKATILNYEVTNKWTTKELDGQKIVDANGNPVLERTTKSVNLTAYLPISISFSKYKKVESPAVPYSVIYDMNGVNPSYYKNKFELFDKYGNEIKDVKWYDIIEEKVSAAVKDKNGNTIEANYQNQFYPTIQVSKDETEYTLLPQTMFFKDTTGKGYGYSLYGLIKELSNDGATLTIKPVWIQPVLIIQNKYGSSMLNSWDGNLIIDEDNNTIMSALIGAGIKNSDNTFSGVLMGEVQTKADLEEKIGLYGFDHGDQSFGFRVDGTAFLGASGKGRIYFDGNTGIIKSGIYDRENNVGMLIDLNSGLDGKTDGSAMAMYGINSETKGKQGFEIDTTTGTVLNLFVKNEVPQESEETKSILKIGSDEYVLQTANFTNGGKNYSPAGLKIDLHSGALTGYDFNLKAINKDGKGSLTIHSNAEEYPFSVNDKLQIAWDGTLNINNHFKAFPDGAIAIGNKLELNKNYGFSNGSTYFDGGNPPNFYITSTGYLYAEQGCFKGEIAGNSVIAGSATVNGGFFIRGKGMTFDEEKAEYIPENGIQDDQLVGSVGHMVGMDASGILDKETGEVIYSETYGIALSNADKSKYIIATNAGIRVQSDRTCFFLTDKEGIAFRAKNEYGDNIPYYPQGLTQEDREPFRMDINGYTILHEANWVDYVSSVITRFT